MGAESPNLRILIVDDDRALRHVLSTVLKDAGHLTETSRASVMRPSRTRSTIPSVTLSSARSRACERADSDEVLFVKYLE